ncbi:MAG: ATP-binding cassette domain-containing protein, partial [bacterium]|nr:ATP-binding cassette domain-containing protein [bacterium]
MELPPKAHVELPPKAHVELPPKAHVELPPKAHVELKGVTKRFGGTLALDGVDVAVRVGAVHAIVGENGAGKSTAGKIVAGVLAPDAGKLLLHGAAVAFRTPRAALAAGIKIGRASCRAGVNTRPLQDAP